MEYYSQLMQDKLVDEFFEQKENGFYIEIGAHDGISGSNTFFFEKFRNWNGLCIEPGPEEFKNLVSNRKSTNLNVCVSDYDGESEFSYIEGYSMMLSGLSESYDFAHRSRINNEMSYYGGKINKLTMPVFKLQTILDNLSITDIDYCSIDTEGSEFNIIKSIDFDKTNIKLFSIENNYGDTQIQNYLEKRGYILYKKLDWDDIFIKV